jgi:hypothetical protein
MIVTLIVIIVVVVIIVHETDLLTRPSSWIHNARDTQTILHLSCHYVGCGRLVHVAFVWIMIDIVIGQWWCRQVHRGDQFVTLLQTVPNGVQRIFATRYEGHKFHGGFVLILRRRRRTVVADQLGVSSVNLRSSSCRHTGLLLFARSVTAGGGIWDDPVLGFVWPYRTTIP